MKLLRGIFILILPLCLFFSSGCAGVPEAGQPRGVSDCDALCGDAAGYAKIHGLSSAEALRRLRLQRSIGGLDAKIAKGEPDTYAGLWIRHEPTYGIAINIAGDPDVVSKYVSGTPLADLVETHRVEKSMKRLEFEQARTTAILDDFDVPLESGINVPQNQVEIYVLDRQAVKALATTLGAAGTGLTEVKVIEVPGFSQTDELE